VLTDPETATVFLKVYILFVPVTENNFGIYFAIKESSTI